MNNYHQLSLDVINDKIFKNIPFSKKEVCDEILSKGGILRVGICVTIGDYLEKLVENEVISFDMTMERYYTTQKFINEHGIITGAKLSGGFVR